MAEFDRINFLLNNPSEATQDDIVVIENEIAKYPYAQFLYVLLAKIKNTLNTEDKKLYITKAAIYSSDRLSLKKVILEQNFLEKIEEIAPYQDLTVFESEETSLFDGENLEEGENESATIFDEVLKNLEKLKSLRKQFQFLEINDSPDKDIEDKPAKKKRAPKKEKGSIKSVSRDHKQDAEFEKKQASRKKKLDKILEKDEILDSQVNVYLLNEIEEKKEKPDKKKSIKLIDQKGIIEKFIEEQPSIGSLKNEIEKSQDEINRDLSEKSTKFGDDLVSENLAIILFKQGKKERAIDIYKKLIWKLPQKKAYFAARIEEIKK